METAVIVAVITVGGSALVAAVTFLLNSRQTRRDELQQRKLESYTELLSALSDLAVTGLDEHTNRRYATAVNTIGLTAPQYVIEALLAFADEIRVSNRNRSPERHDQLLSALIFQMRRSLEPPFSDDVTSFGFRLVGGGPGQPPNNAFAADAAQRPRGAQLNRYLLLQPNLQPAFAALAD